MKRTFQLAALFALTAAFFLGLVAGVDRVAEFHHSVYAQWNGPLTGRGIPSNLAYIPLLLAGNIPATGTNPGGTAVPIASTTIPTGDFALCGTNGCRIRFHYNYSISGGTQGLCYVTDNVGAAPYGKALALTVNNFTPCEASGLSLTQFSAGANPTVAVTLYDLGTTEVCQYQTLTPSAAGCASSATGATQGYTQFEVVESN